MRWDDDSRPYYEPLSRHEKLRTALILLAATPVLVFLSWLWLTLLLLLPVD